jgi:GTPase SAR1 family protein
MQQPIFNKNASAPLGGNAEDIQILLLGPPGSGKTSLQARYTLRQFSQVVSGGLHHMGGHKHIPMPDGREVHLIIHEFPTGSGQQTSSIMDPFSPDDISHQDTLTSSSSAYQAEVQRKKLLEQSDAVMLLFNPWSKESFEWVNGNVVADIINSGRKEKVRSDIVGILDSLAAAIPGIQRSRTTRSIKLPQREFPRRPSSPADDKSGVSLFSGLDEKKGWGNDRSDYHGELKRISILVEGSALKRAEFMIHERDLPGSLGQNPGPKSLVISGPMALSDRKLPTIREVDSNVSMGRNALMWDSHKGAPSDRRRDSAASFRTTSSAYSQASSTVVGDAHGASVRESNPFTLEDLIDAHMAPLPPEEPPERPPEKRATLLPLLPTEELEIPVLVVASMTDRLEDHGGRLPRMVSALQGQELARKFGSNAAYVEVSAKTNANVDEAFGILVDQVMSKRALRQQEDLDEKKPSDNNKVREIVIVGEENVMDKDENDRSLPARAVRAKIPRQKSRSCMPPWWDKLMGSVFSWAQPDSEVSAITFEDIGVRRGEQETKEDVWGETVAVKSSDKTSWSAMRKSRAAHARQSVSTVSTDSTDSTDTGDTINGFSIVTPSKIQRAKAAAAKVPEVIDHQPSKLPAPPPAVLPPDEGDKNARRSDEEALMDKLERKLSSKKKQCRPESMTLGYNSPLKAAHPDSSDEKPRRSKSTMEKVSRKNGLHQGGPPLPLDEKPQPSLPLPSKDDRPLSVDSSIARSLARTRSNKKQRADRTRAIYLTNYDADNTTKRSNIFDKPLPGPKTTNLAATDLVDDTSSSLITTATSTVAQRRQHTSLVSELPPSIPPLRFDVVRFLDDDRRFTVMIRLAEQELEQQRARVRKLVCDDAAAAAPVTRSRSVGAASAAGRRGPGTDRPRGVGTNAVGPVRATYSTARDSAVARVQQQQQQPHLPFEHSARGRKSTGDLEQQQQQQQRQQQQVGVIRMGPYSTTRPNMAPPMNRRAVPTRTQAQGQAMVKSATHPHPPPPPPPPPPPSPPRSSSHSPNRRPATMKAVPPPMPASRPRTRPISERRPPGRPAPIWI